MNASLLLLEAFTYRYSTVSGNKVIFGLMGSTAFSACPLCQKASSKVHSYYQQRVQDLPVSGKTVKL